MKRHIKLTILLVMAAAMPTSVFAQAPDAPAENLNPAVLEVNGEKVYAGEITMVMQNISAQTGGQVEGQNREALVQMAMQRIVEQKLLAQEARRTGVKANEERLAEMTQVVVQQAGGREKLESNLANFGMSYEQLMTSLLEMELTRSMIESQISPTIEVSDEEVKSFYEENPQFFDAAEQVHVRQIIFKVGLDADAETVGETRAKAEDARSRALAGEDFAELARELSEGASAANGGDLGFLTREQMTAPQFANAAFATEPGGITPVVRTNFGFHVIKVEEMRPARHVPLDEVFENVRSVLVQQKTGQAVGELVKTLGEKATIVTLVTGPAAVNQAPPQ
jgi:parvulin-like peptidyl-prolyl isomerase